MLTKQDLQQIGVVVNYETKSIIQTELKPIKEYIRILKRDVTQIRASQNEIIRFFEREYLELRQRIDRIEEFFKLPPI